MRLDEDQDLISTQAQLKGRLPRWVHGRCRARLPTFGKLIASETEKWGR